MFKASGFKPSNDSVKAKKLESLVRIAIMHKELSPGVAAQINQCRNGKLTCKERRIMAILDDAIASGHVVPIAPPAVPALSRRTARKVS